MKTNRNNWLGFILACVMLTCTHPTANAQGSLDRIHRRNGSDRGKVTAITSQAVTLSKGGVETNIPSEEIRRIQFAGEPAELNQARLAAASGRYQEARIILASIDSDGVGRDGITQDIQFTSALCAAKLALSGQGNIEQATKQVAGFLTRHRTSYHLPATFELLGDLLAGAGRHDEARRQYALLGKARSPIYKIRSALLIGRSYQEENKHADALAQFDKVLQSTDKRPLAEDQRLEASLGKAVSQAATGAGAEAIAAINRVISTAEPEDVRLHAQAYNALGDCYRNSGKEKAALYAFLHTDLLYNKVPPLHAKALHELAQLWQAEGHPTRAREAQQKLEKQYPGSRWAK